MNFAKTNRLLTYAAQFSMFGYKKTAVWRVSQIWYIFIGSDNVLPVFFKQKSLILLMYILDLKFIRFGIMPLPEEHGRSVIAINNA